MRYRYLSRALALCSLSAMLDVQSPLTVLADGEMPDTIIETIDDPGVDEPCS